MLCRAVNVVRAMFDQMFQERLKRRILLPVHSRASYVINVLIWVACAPYFFDSSASVISSRIASRATLALNSGEWFFRFAILDRVLHQAICLDNWSEIP